LTAYGGAIQISARTFSPITTTARTISAIPTATIATTTAAISPFCQ
jgi:hypothetical protein